MLKTLYTGTYGAIYDSCYCAMQICFIFSLPKFVDEVGSTVLNRNLCWIFAERGLSGRLLKQTVL